MPLIHKKSLINNLLIFIIAVVTIVNNNDIASNHGAQAIPIGGPAQKAEASINEIDFWSEDSDHAERAGQGGHGHMHLVHAGDVEESNDDDDRSIEAETRKRDRKKKKAFEEWQKYSDPRNRTRPP